LFETLDRGCASLGKQNEQKKHKHSFILIESKECCQQGKRNSFQRVKEKKMSAKILAITNQKGGVGKTTTAINLGAGLRQKGFKVLLVDLDPQGSLTQSLGIDLSSVSVSIGELISDRSLPIKSAIYQSKEGMPVLASHPRLAGVSRLMVTMTNAELRVKQRLEVLKSQYDFIIIDSSPSFGPLLNSSLNRS
jgi:chromosome partitioning protein